MYTPSSPNQPAADWSSSDRRAQVPGRTTVRRVPNDAVSQMTGLYPDRVNPYTVWLSAIRLLNDPA